MRKYGTRQAPHATPPRVDPPIAQRELGVPRHERRRAASRYDTMLGAVFDGACGEGRTRAHGPRAGTDRGHGSTG